MSALTAMEVWQNARAKNKSPMSDSLGRKYNMSFTGVFLSSNL